MALVAGSSAAPNPSRVHRFFLTPTLPWRLLSVTFTRTMIAPVYLDHQVTVSVGLVAASSAAVIGWAPEAQGSGVPEVMAYLNGCMMHKVGAWCTWWAGSTVSPDTVARTGTALNVVIRRRSWPTSMGA